MDAPATGEIVLERDLAVITPDGVRLATDVYRPAGAGPFPVFLKRTPYDKTASSRSERTATVVQTRSPAEVAAYFVHHGYAVGQDGRGHYYPTRLELFPTAKLFCRGQRLRLDIASSNFPHFDVNPNSGEAAGAMEDPRVPRNRIFVAAAHPSHLVLPISPAEK